MGRPLSSEASLKGPVVIILGPTAVGKSAVAIEVALRLNGEVISADSRAFFRGLDIATDKPLPTSRRGVPHHLIDIVDIDGSYDAMAFRKDSDHLIQEIKSRGRVPIITGGGTLYLGAILEGIFTGPSADNEVRQALLSRPLDELYTKLTKVDPTAARNIHQNDRLRIVRALEVYQITGQPISVLQQETSPLPYLFVIFGLKRQRADHRVAIAARVNRMLKRGLIAEVERLRHEGLCEDNQVYRTIGVRETFAFLKGEISEEELKEMIVHNTWELVRRQMAWFRREKKATWIDVTARPVGAVAEEIVAQVSRLEQKGT